MGALAKEEMARIGDVKIPGGVITSQQDRTFIYALTNDSPGKVTKIEKSGMRVVKQGSLSTRDLENSVSDSQFLYIGAHTSPSLILKVRKTDLAEVGKMVIMKDYTAITMQQGTPLYVFFYNIFVVVEV
jgi:hypothetical protein